MFFLLNRSLIAITLSLALWSWEYPHTTPVTTGPDMTSGFQGAHWGTNVTVTFANGNMTYVSDGIPNHPRDAEYAIPGRNGGTVMTDPTRAQNYRFTIPMTPVPAAKPTPTNMGVIGVMISGASLFNPFEGDGRTIAMQSNFAVQNANGDSVWFLDRCNGHPQPMMGTYHYHALPVCVVADVDGATGPSHILGVAFDGYPIYGDRDINGKPIDPMTLDVCNGIDSPTPEFPQGVYHYVLLNTTLSNSSINCFHGVVDPSLQQRGMHSGPPGGGARGGGPPGGGPPGGRRPPPV
jgi:hypothetical protein